MINKVILIGYLGQDPKISYAQSGTAISNLSIATSEKWTDKQGQKQEKTEWHKVVVFGAQAEVCEKYLAKGAKIYVEGRLQTDSYEQDGVTKYSTKIIANIVKFLNDFSSQKAKEPSTTGQNQEVKEFAKELEFEDIPF